MNNLFSGKEKSSKLAILLYKRYISRKWFSYSQVIADYNEISLSDVLKCGITNCNGYKEFKKIAGPMQTAIQKEAGKETIVTNGNNRDQKIRYVGKKKNPLSEMIATATKDNIRKYYQFCQDSAGFFPASWLDYYLGDTIDLLNIGLKEALDTPIMGTSLGKEVENIEHLPDLYESIKGKTALRITYNAHFEEKITIVFHPHFLKEYNGRWFVVGSAEEMTPSEGVIIALDRIETLNYANVPYKEPEGVEYPGFFDDIVGTTHVEGAVLSQITIRVYDKYIFGLVTTKKIHHNQETTREFDNDLGYGEVTMTLRPNNEFYGVVLRLGPDLEILTPKDVRDELAMRIYNMNTRYQKHE